MSKILVIWQNKPREAIILFSHGNWHLLQVENITPFWVKSNNLAII